MTRLIILYFLIVAVAVVSCQKELNYPNYQSGEAPIEPGGIVASDFQVSTIPADLLVRYEMDGGYYEKYTSIWGIPIVASTEVEDIYLQNAAEMVGLILSDESLLSDKAKLIRDLLYKNMLRIAIYPSNGKVGTKQLPEFRIYSDADAYGAIPEAPVIGVGDVTVQECVSSGYVIDFGRFKQGNSLVHEVMHALHLLIGEEVYPGFNQKLREAYQQAQTEQKWPAGTYINTNTKEYLAEGAEVWFNWHPYRTTWNNTDVAIDQDILKEMDPALYDLMACFFQPGKDVMNYISFCSPRVSFKIDITLLLGRDFDYLKQRIYGDGNLIYEQRADSYYRTSSACAPDPRFSYLAYDNYRIEVVGIYGDGRSDEVVFVKEYNQDELIAEEGFPNVYLQVE